MRGVKKDNNSCVAAQIFYPFLKTAHHKSNNVIAVLENTGATGTPTVHFWPRAPKQINPAIGQEG